MTCIVGIVDKNGKIVIGGDSAGVADWDLTPRADKKVFKNGEFIFGFTSSFRMGQLLQYKFKAPTHPSEMNVSEYMNTLFIDAVRECLKQGGYAAATDGRERGGTFLVGYRGRLFCIESDYQVGESLHPFNACGCGAQIALGSFHSTKGKNLTHRATAALQAAEAFSAGVRAPFSFIELKH